MMTTQSKELRWGILGCARIARRGLIPGIQGSASGTVQAISSRDAAVARSWAEEFSIPRAYDSYRAVLDDPDVDAVYIPLPNELHRPWTIAAADAGKHVLCEKPLALDAREAATMVSHCAECGVLLMEAFMWRHQPRTAAILQLLKEGTIGRLRLIRSSFSFPIEPGDWRLDRARGGGALWDVGCYGVNTARLFMGREPLSLHSIAHMSPTGVDLSLTAQLGFAEGALTIIDCSFEQPFRCSYELVGCSGSIHVPDAYLPPTDPVAHINNANGQRTMHFDGTNQYAAMVDAFARSVASGVLVDPCEDGLAQMIVLDAIHAHVTMV